VNRFEDYTAAAPNAWAGMAEAAEKQTKEDTRRLNEQLQSTNTKSWSPKAIWETLAKLIREREIDLVVLGTRGRTGLGKRVLLDFKTRLYHASGVRHTQVALRPARFGGGNFKFPGRPPE
jgi:Universal stress protein family